MQDRKPMQSIRESFFHKLLFAGLLNLLLGSCGNKVAQASLVVDNLIGEMCIRDSGEGVQYSEP